MADVLNKAVFSADLEDNWRFFDFGKHAFAVLEIDVETDREQNMILAVGEVLKDGRIDRAPGGSRVFQEQEVVLHPGKNHVNMVMTHKSYNSSTQLIEPNVAPFRYAEIRDLPDGAEVVQHMYYGDFDDDAADFKSNLPDLDRIWEFCKYTMKATSAFGVFIDGDRERQPYEGDTYINQLSYLVCTPGYEMARDSIEWLWKNPTWPTEWRLIMIPIVHDYLLYSGDIESVRRWYGNLKENLLQGAVAENGLLNAALLEGKMLSLGINNVPVNIHDIVDWPAGERDGYEFGEYNLVPNCWHRMALGRMADIAELLGLSEDAEMYREASERSRAAIRGNMLKNGMFTDNPDSEHTALHSAVFPVLWDIAEENEKAEILKFIRGKGMACSVFVAKFLLECCFANGCDDYAFDLLLSRGKRSWHNMLACGATMTMEAWDDEFKPNQDWNHPWGSAPANIIVRTIAGIRPLTPGFRKFAVDPHPGKLEYFDVRTPTPAGEIFFKWLKNGECRLTVPNGTTAVYCGREYGAGEHILSEKICC